MARAVDDHIMTPFPLWFSLTSIEQDMEALLMRGDETRSYHTIEQCPWELKGYQLEGQPALQVQLKRERLPLEDL